MDSRVIWAAYWTFWGVWCLVALEVAGLPMFSLVSRPTLAGFRPTPLYRQMVARYAGISHT
jgi:hypothetical protein